MPSPFPGMNPYLEQNDTWEDFHNTFITHARNVLSGCVGANYLVKIEVRLFLHELSAKERHHFGRADVGVTAPGVEGQAAASPAQVDAPVRLVLPAIDVERYASLEIRDRRDRRLVTVLELLSPTNKRPGPDRDEYLAKRSQLFVSKTHLVEIDLRRGCGARPHPPALPPCDYYVMVSRSRERPDLDFWPIALRDRLPVIPIPLAPPDPDIPLDLQELLNRVYDAADYGKYIYGETPEPPLSGDDAAWARQFIPQVP